ncbi:hypothetical protein Hypma_009884 [Hypsizygus marmoreus]|uniref:Alpha/beta hydrolase fold-3 domain-containing protein n=1 Tax=Hypsizygus marmoreus TaxID=39966 RepID=A0A369JM80_HYPMA|nr:hypothetical protein Hypma_009884 [Hypsizygus marmoreus]
MRLLCQGASEPLEVGVMRDFKMTHTSLRTFTPPREPPEGVNFLRNSAYEEYNVQAGGRWETSPAKRRSQLGCVSVRAKAVIVSMDYRLAPEHPIPRQSMMQSTHWSGSFSMITVGGSSRQVQVFVSVTSKPLRPSKQRRQLAAILALKAVECTPPIPLLFQLLIVPVTDNTASTVDLWAENQRTAWLSSDRMLWFCHGYLPSENDWTKWDTSPIFAPADLLKKVPKAWITVAELEKEEGVRYSEKMREAGVEVVVVVYGGGAHPIMAMDG